MNFLYTKYFYPFEKPLIVSKYFNYEFDNPRTEEEIAIARKSLHEELKNGKAISLGFGLFKIPSIFFLDSAKDALSKFKELFKDKESYFNNFFEYYNSEDTISLIARMLVIIRYPKNLEEKWNKELDELSSKTFTTTALQEIIESSPWKELINYSYLLSLLISSQQYAYEGQTFLIPTANDGVIKFPQKNEMNESLLKCFEQYFCFATRNIFDENSINPNLIWSYFVTVKPYLENLSVLLDTCFENNNEDKEKLCYIADILRMVDRDIIDDKTKLLMLTSIVELLLTRNPKTERFNVEDSINKQFQLKTGTVAWIMFQDPNIPEHLKHSMEFTQNQLKSIYDCRSKIAHGDFKELEKTLQKLQVDENGKKQTIKDLIHSLYGYIRKILSLYLTDRDFIVFLKNG